MRGKGFVNRIRESLRKSWLTCSYPLICIPPSVVYIPLIWLDKLIPNVFYVWSMHLDFLCVQLTSYPSLVDGVLDSFLHAVLAICLV